MARRDRFEQGVLERVAREGFNPYNNINLLMEMEAANGLRSTFFFRPRYDDGTPVSEYASYIGDLKARGWEVGAHLNDAGSLESIRSERDQIGKVLGAPPLGCRVHYLRLNEGSHSYMRRAGFEYDSSVMPYKDQVSPKSAGFQLKEGLIVFPITIMDAYLFTYMKVPEDKVPGVLEAAIASCKATGYMTILWHDNSVLMKGGRAYARICEVLASRKDVECVTAIEACQLLTKEAKE